MTTANILMVGFDGNPETVQVDVKFRYGGWVVHKPYMPYWFIQKHEMTQSDVIRLTRGWAVTHAASGLRAVHLATKPDAKACCRALRNIELSGPDDTAAMQRVLETLATLGLRPGVMDQRVEVRS